MADFADEPAGGSLRRWRRATKRAASTSLVALPTSEGPRGSGTPDNGVLPTTTHNENESDC